MKIMKKAIALTLCAVITLGGCCVTAFAADGTIKTGEITFEGNSLRHSVVPKSSGKAPQAGYENDSDDLPASYDARETGNINPPEEQYYGDCWAFSTMSTLEASVMTDTSEEQHFSKSHLTWFAFNHLNEGATTNDVWNDGGNYLFASGPLANHEGIAAQADYPNKKPGDGLEFTDADRFNTGSGYVLDDLTLFFDETQVKKWIMAHGAISACYFESGDSCHSDTYGAEMIYNGISRFTNHAITIIGWDDNVPAGEFTPCGRTPSKNGAWLIKNSWYGDDTDYMYLSYSQYIEEFAGYTAKKDITYNNYTHSESIYNTYAFGSFIEYGDVFKAQGNETINDICFYLDTIGQLTEVTATFNIYRFLPENYTSPTDGKLVATYTEKYTNDGCYTFEVPDIISLEKDEIYAVTIACEDSGKCIICLPLEKNMEDFSFKCNAGESYVRTDKGDALTDVKQEFKNLKNICNTWMHIYTTCNHIVEEKDGVRVCAQCGRELGEPCEQHVSGYYRITKPATYTEEGIKETRCKICGEVIGEETIPVKKDPTLKIANLPKDGSVTLDYGTVARFKAEVTDLPEDCAVVWYYPGMSPVRGNEIEFEVKSPGDLTVKIEYADGTALKTESGETITASEKINVNAGFFKKVIAFFKKLFRNPARYTQ